MTLISFHKSAELLIGPQPINKDTTFNLTDGDITSTNFTMLISNDIFGYTTWTLGKDSYMDLGNNFQISNVRFYSYTPLGRSLEVWGSNINPNADFFPLGAVYCDIIGWCEIPINNPTPYRYLRFRNDIDNSDLQINEVEVYGMAGSLNLSSDPIGAKIWLAPAGQTPTDTGRITPDTIPDLPEGFYDFILTLVGYRDFPGRVDIRRDEITTVSSTMEPIQCELISMSLTSVDPIIVGDSRSLRGDITPPGSYYVRFHDGTELLGETTSDKGIAIFTWETTPLTPIGTHHITAYVQSPIPCNSDEILIDVLPAMDVCFQSTPAGASISIDGILQTGKYTTLSGTECTPESIVTTTQRSHTVEINLEGYEPRIESFFDVFVDIGELTPLPGKIVVLTIPPGGRIYYDLIDTGMNASAIIADVASNISHNVKITLADYQDFETSIAIDPGQTGYIYTIMTPITPPVGIGNINVTSTPDGVAFELYTGENGTAPTVISDIPAGINLYEAGGLEGYNWAAGSFTIKDGKTIDLNIPLQLFTENMGLVVIESIPMGTDIYIDGSPIGTKTTFITMMSAGIHTYELRLNGYVSKSGNFTIVTGYDIPVIISETLQPVSTGTAIILLGGTAVGLMMLSPK